MFDRTDKLHKLGCLHPNVIGFELNDQNILFQLKEDCLDNDKMIMIRCMLMNKLYILCIFSDGENQPSKKALKKQQKAAEKAAKKEERKQGQDDQKVGTQSHYWH